MTTNRTVQIAVSLDSLRVARQATDAMAQQLHRQARLEMRQSQPRVAESLLKQAEALDKAVADLDRAMADMVVVPVRTITEKETEMTTNRTVHKTTAEQIEALRAIAQANEIAKVIVSQLTGVEAVDAGLLAGYRRVVQQAPHTVDPALAEALGA